MDNNGYEDLVFEDISSHSQKPITRAAKKVKKATDVYANGAYKNIDKVIKVIAFIVAIAVFVIFVGLAAILFLLDKAFLLVSAAVLLVGAAVSLILLFLIYGTGHIISQNKEILRRLEY
ncbi:MAG: hypothetical protein ACOYJS_00900 [Acutalibacteraceae bacterium]